MQYSKTRLPLGMFIALLALLPACHLRPQMGSPGTMGQQRDRAAVHDPFPDNDLGPPIISGRPRGFDRPNSEPKRLQHDNPYASRQSSDIQPPPFGF